MPKIFEYLGILIFFYSNEHEPIHVHGKYDGFESKAEFYIVDGEIVEIKIKGIAMQKKTMILIFCIWLISYLFNLSNS